MKVNSRCPWRDRGSLLSSHLSGAQILWNAPVFVLYRPLRNVAALSASGSLSGPQPALRLGSRRGERAAAPRRAARGQHWLQDPGADSGRPKQSTAPATVGLWDFQGQVRRRTEEATGRMISPAAAGCREALGWCPTGRNGLLPRGSLYKRPRPSGRGQGGRNNGGPDPLGALRALGAVTRASDTGKTAKTGRAEEVRLSAVCTGRRGQGVVP